MSLSEYSDLPEMSKHLLPCPFCGGEACLAWYNFSTEMIVAECENCGCATVGAKTAEGAIKRWNRRPSDSKGLKPCPFCGSPAKLDKFDNGECDMYQVVCTNPKCRAETGNSSDASDVITDWNKRTDEEGERD